MRNLKKNEQQMYYSLVIGEEPIYELDEKGEPIVDYVDEEGNIYYRETGEYKPVFSIPRPFKNGISGKLSEVLVKEFGIDDTTLYAEMETEANKYQIAPESIIWRKSEVKYEDVDQTIPDRTSCDYVVAGVLDEGLNTWLYLLRRNLK